MSKRKKKAVDPAPNIGAVNIVGSGNVNNGTLKYSPDTLSSCDDATIGYCYHTRLGSQTVQMIGVIVERERRCALCGEMAKDLWTMNRRFVTSDGGCMLDPFVLVCCSHTPAVRETADDYRSLEPTSKQLLTMNCRCSDIPKQEPKDVDTKIEASDEKEIPPAAESDGSPGAPAVDGDSGAAKLPEPDRDHPQA